MRRACSRSSLSSLLVLSTCRSLGSSTPHQSVLIRFRTLRFSAVPLPSLPFNLTAPPPLRHLCSLYTASKHTMAAENAAASSSAAMTRSVDPDSAQGSEQSTEFDKKSAQQQSTDTQAAASHSSHDKRTITPLSQQSTAQCPMWHVSPESIDTQLQSQLAQAATLLRQHQCIAFPTETVYGLGANACESQAVARIFAAKGRPSDNPLIVHIADPSSQLASLVDMSRVGATARLLMRHFWPGPLTLVLPLHPEGKNPLSPLVTCGLRTVGIRVPQHSVALALLRACNLPLAAPSANTSGRPSPTTAQHVAHDLASSFSSSSDSQQCRIAGIVDGGATQCGLESTVVQCADDLHSDDNATATTTSPATSRLRATILRPGSVTLQQLEQLLGGKGTVAYAHNVHLSQPRIETQLSSLSIDDQRTSNSNSHSAPATEASTSSSPAPIAPGMKYAHYAPRAPMTLVQGDVGFLIRALRQRVRAQPTSQHQKQHIAVLCNDAMMPALQQLRTEFESHKNNDYNASRSTTQLHLLSLGSSLEHAAHRLYASLRECDALTPAVSHIYCSIASFHNQTNDAAAAVTDDGLSAALMNRLVKAADNRWLVQSVDDDAPKQQSSADLQQLQQQHDDQESIAVAPVTQTPAQTAKATTAATAAATRATDSKSDWIAELNSDYSKLEYWQQRFANEEQYDWLTDYSAIQPLLLKYLLPLCSAAPKQPPQRSMCRILMIGCGNSKLSEQMYADGFTCITNIDFDDQVIARQARTHVDKPEMTWHCCDMTRMDQFADSSFDCVLDKASMDSLLVNEGSVWSPALAVREQVFAYLSHVKRVLRPGGQLLQITWQQPHFRLNNYLQPKRDTEPDFFCFDCDWRSVTKEEFTLTAKTNFPYFLYCATK